MTVIIGFLDNNKMYMASDQQTTSGASKSYCNDKVFCNEFMIFGVTGKLRISEILKYIFKMPSNTLRSDIEYMNVVFCPALRDCFNDNGALQTRDGVISFGFSAEILVGYRGSFYRIYNDFTCLKTDKEFAVVGSGADYAIGSIDTYCKCFESSQRDIKFMLESAVETANAHSLYCSGAAIIKYLEYKETG